MRTRVVAAAAVFISAVVHISLWFAGYNDVAVIGPAFLLNAVSGVVIAILLLRLRNWIPLLLAVGFGVATLGAFILSVTVGLFGLQEDGGGVSQWIAAVSEVVAIVAGVAGARSEGYLPWGRPQAAQ
ncbi:MAG: hypothetical protein ACRDO0_10155 [Nocardioidaceae bacterium]